jgi:DNA-directed RNA polymerase specialized sigma24 family protein
LSEPRTAAAYSVSTADGLRSLAPEGSVAFFQRAGKPRIAHAMWAGATEHEAEEAAAETMKDMLRRWSLIDPTLAYARKAVVHAYIKEKTRGPARTVRRLIEQGQVTEGADDDQLAVLETEDWLACIFSYLTAAQCAVMECIARGTDQSEVAAELGISKDNARRHLCDARKRLTDVLHRDGELRLPPPRKRPSRKETI